MSLYEGLFAAKKIFGLTKDSPEHFQVRPFVEHLLDSEPAIQPPRTNGCHGPAGHAAAAPPPPCDYYAANGHTVVADDDVPFEPVPVANREIQWPGSATPPAHTAPASSAVPNAWNDHYDRSLGNIQDHIHAVAGAVAMLDAVEHKLIAIKCELQRIRDAKLLIDGDKVLIALQVLADYVNQAVTNVDDQCVNMLRDSKMEIKFAGLDAATGQPDGVALTMISIERLLDFKIKSALAEGLVAEETPEFVNDICAIVSSNIQILTSIMLALFASRDYTQAVTRLAARENIIPAISATANGQISSATIDRLQLQHLDQRGGANGEHLQQGRASLTELLKNVRENRGEASTTFG